MKRKLAIIHATETECGTADGSVCQWLGGFDEPDGAYCALFQRGEDLVVTDDGRVLRDARCLAADAGPELPEPLRPSIVILDGPAIGAPLPPLDDVALNMLRRIGDDLRATKRVDGSARAMLIGPSNEVPGALHVGIDDVPLTRGEVAELAAVLRHWLDTGDVPR